MDSDTAQFVKPMPRSKKERFLLSITKARIDHINRDNKYVASLENSTVSSVEQNSQRKHISEVKKRNTEVSLKDSVADMEEDSGIASPAKMEPSSSNLFMRQAINLEQLDDSYDDIDEDRNLHTAALYSGVDVEQLVTDQDVKMSPVESAQNHDLKDPLRLSAPGSMSGLSLFEFPSQLDTNEVLIHDRSTPALKKIRISKPVFSEFTDNDIYSYLKNSTMVVGGNAVKEIPLDISEIEGTSKSAPPNPKRRLMPFTKGVSATNPKKGKSLALALSFLERNETSSDNGLDEEPTLFPNGRKMPPLPLHVAFEDLPQPSQNFEPIELRLKKNSKFQAKVQRQRAKVAAERAASEAQRKEPTKKPRRKSKKHINTITPFATNKGNLKFYAQYKVTNESCETFHRLVDEWADFTLDQVENFCADEGKGGLDTKEDVLKLLQRQGIVKNYWEQSGLCHELLTYDESNKLLANDWPNGKEFTSGDAALSKGRVRKVPRKKKATRKCT